MTKKRGRRRWLRRVGFVFLSFLALLVFAYIFRWALFENLVKEQVAEALAGEGMEVTIDRISGTVFTDLEVNGFRVHDAPGQPFLRDVQVDQVKVEFSLLGLLTGAERPVHSVTVVGVRAVVDLDRLPSGDSEPEPPSESEGPDLLPEKVDLRRLTVTLTKGADRFRVAEGRLGAVRGEGSDLTGGFGATLVEILFEGEDRDARDADGGFSVENGLLRIDRLSADGLDYGEVLRLDLAALAEERVDADVHLPLLDGRVDVTAKLDLAGEHPAGRAEVVIGRLDPTPLLRFVPADLPVGLRGIEGTVTIDLGGEKAPDFSSTRAAFDLRVDGPRYEEWTVESAELTGTIEDGVIDARGKTTGPSIGFWANVRPEEEPPTFSADVLAANLDLGALDLPLHIKPMAGTATLTAKARGRLEAPEFEVSLGAERVHYGEHSADRIDLLARGTPDHIEVGTLDVEARNAKVRVRNASLTPEPLRFEGEAEVSVEAMERWLDLLPEDVPRDLAGGLELTVKADGTPEEPNATFELTLTDLTAEELETSRLTAAGTVETLERFAVRELTLAGSDSLPALDLGDARVALDGRLPSVSIGRLTVEKEGRVVRSCDRISAEPDGDLYRVSLPLGCGNVRMNAVAAIDAEDRITGSVDILEFELERSEGVLPLPFPMTGAVTGRIEVSGTLEEPEGSVRLRVTDPGASPPDVEPVSMKLLTLEAAYTKGRARLDRLLLDGGGWSLSAAGEAALDLTDADSIPASAVTGTITLTSLPLDAAGPLPGIGHAAGTLGADLTIAGTVEAPVVNGGVRLHAAEIVPEGALPDRVSNVVVELEARDLSPDSGTVLLTRLEATALDATVSGSGEIRHDGSVLTWPVLDISMPEVDLERLAKLAGVEETVYGVLSARVLTGPGPRAEIDVSGRDLQYGENEAQDLVLKARWDGQILAVEEGRLVVFGRPLLLEGSVPLRAVDGLSVELPENEPIRARIHGDRFSLAALPLEGTGMRTAGNLSLDLVATGTLADTALTGTVALEDARLRAAGAPPFDNVNAKIRLEPGRIEIEEFNGYLGRGGWFKLTGGADRIPIAKMSDASGITNIHLDIEAKNALLVREDKMVVRADLLPFTISGPDTDHLTIEGRMVVRHLRYFENVEYLQNQPTLAPLPLTDEPFFSQTALNLLVEIQRGAARMRNNLLDARLEGTVQVRGNVAVPRPEGRIRVVKGTVHLPAVSMDISRSAIDFRSTEPMRPYLDARAAAEISGVDVLAQVEGPANDFELKLSSTPPYPEMEVLSLIATGVLRSDFGAQAMGGVAARMLYREITSSFSSRDEDSTLSELASRVELDVDASPVSSGGVPRISATVRVLGDWLFVRGIQDDPSNYGLDLIFRLSFP